MRNRYLVYPSIFFIVVPFLALILARALIMPRPDYASLKDIPFEPVHDLNNTETRQIYWLDGRDWEFRREGEDTWQAGMRVPACWNVVRGLEDFEGRAFYRKRFSVPSSSRDKRLFLVFRGVSYHAKVFLNGKEVGTHEGAYTQFEFEITDYVDAGSNNILEVEVDNRLGMTTLPGGIKGWKHVGGIYREVYVDARPGIYFQDVFIQAEPQVDEIPGPEGVKGFASIKWSAAGQDDGRNLFARFVFRAQEGKLVIRPVESEDGDLSVSFDSILPWSPDSPDLYTVEAELLQRLESGEALVDRLSFNFGFKKIETRGRRIFLNGRPFKVRGIGRHEDFPGFLKTQPARVMEDDVRKIKELGANFLRLGHYPNHPYILDLCDRQGILVWEELPAWGAGSPDYGNEHVIELGRSQVWQMISRDRNHVCVGFWGLGNQVPTDTRKGAMFVKEMASAARELDQKRLLVAASDTHEKDKSIPFLDVASFNSYQGWYQGSARDFRDYIQRVGRAFPDKPILFSEYGAGAEQGRHGASRRTRPGCFLRLEG
jgi:beta-glucuronidase